MSRVMYPAWIAVPIAALAAAVAASLGNSLIAWVGTLLGVDATRGGVQPTTYIGFTVTAAVLGAIGWHLINRFTRRPSRTIRWLVPAVLLVSFLPDLAVGAGAGTGEGWGYATDLMAMHIATISIATAIYRVLLPLKDRAAAPGTHHPAAASA